MLRHGYLERIIGHATLWVRAWHNRFLFGHLDFGLFGLVYVARQGDSIGLCLADLAAEAAAPADGEDGEEEDEEDVEAEGHVGHDLLPLL